MFENVEYDHKDYDVYSGRKREFHHNELIKLYPSFEKYTLLTLLKLSKSPNFSLKSLRFVTIS